MAGFEATDGALFTAEQHRHKREQAQQRVANILAKYDAADKMALLMMARVYYEAMLPELIHTIIVNGGNLADIRWLAFGGPERIGWTWLSWAQEQVALDPDWSTAVYRQVAVTLDVVDQFNDLLEAKGIMDDGKDR